MYAGNRGRVESIQLLRGIAATLVALGHANSKLAQHLDGISWLALSAASLTRLAVDIFFVISGFLMTYVSANLAPGLESSGFFLSRRLIRLVPCYWFFTSVTLIIVLIAPGAAHKTSVQGIWHVIGSYLFLPIASFEPIVDQGWTLRFEMLFYLLFAGGLAILLPRFIVLALISVLLLGLVSIGLLFDLNSSLSRLFSDPMLGEFVFGIWIAVAFRRYQNGCVIWGFYVLVVTCIWLAVQASFQLFTDNRLFDSGIPAAMLVLGFVSLGPLVKPVVWRGFVPLGDISYSLYLSHGLIESGVMKGLLWAGGLVRLSYDGAVVTLLLSSLIFAGLFYYAVERPVTARLQSWYISRRSNAFSFSST